ncbi:EcsC family protein [Bythopirellula polymerisocia]|uniref:EcsC protein family protein n=1 Tax=Bythopirellula polymerisocia TaxID=2528003 RepID=A0A5C6CZ31_9BACT|nr:EcsC family protein [Bythopirellula polymerisocia]TWU29882.1 EcsC protein family protein [Bythopirellula polymerisocia]
MTEPQPPAIKLTSAAMDELREAKDILEHQGLAERLTELVGAPITASMKLLPDSAERLIYSAVEKSLQKGLDLAVTSLGKDDNLATKPRLLSHKVLAGLSGAAGGSLGGLTMGAELPVSTLLILRSVADIARSQGEDLSQLEPRLACLEVLALAPGPAVKTSEETAAEDDNTDIGYLAVRIAMGKQISDATKYVAQHGLANRAAPPLVQLLNMIGKRFGLIVSEKMAAQAIPVIGAVGGALINTYFIGHFQDIARAHFTIRRLERTYGSSAVTEAYRRLV